MFIIRNGWEENILDLVLSWMLESLYLTWHVLGMKLKSKRELNYYFVYNLNTYLEHVVYYIFSEPVFWQWSSYMESKVWTFPLTESSWHSKRGTFHTVWEHPVCTQKLSFTECRVLDKNQGNTTLYRLRMLLATFLKRSKFNV